MKMGGSNRVSLGMCYGLLAYIRYDFFGRKKLRIPEDYTQAAINARACGFSSDDAAKMFSLLSVPQVDLFSNGDC